MLLSAVIVGTAGLALTAQLSVKSDMSYLLPESSHSVQQLRDIEKRARVTAAFLLGVESDDPKARQAATDRLLQKLKTLHDPDIGSITADDRVARQFAWDNRFLFADEQDLIAARDALQAEIRKANPFYVSLDDREEPITVTDTSPVNRLDELDKKLREAEEKAKTPEPLVSPDKRLQMIIVQATFADGDLDKGSKMAAMLRGLLDETARESGPTVRTGMSADVVRGLVEQAGLIHGMVLATLVTLIAVVAALLLFFRTAAGVLSLCWSLTVGCLATFAVAKLVVGHLNIASAFLSSIVVGNGINFGILVLARFCEERRCGTRADEAVRLAMIGSANGTAAAALAAGVAYVSLIITPFRGFRDFGIIGGVGMVMCWLSAFTVLPAGLLLLEQWGWIRVRPERGAAAWFGRILARPPRIIVPLASILFVATGVGTWRYVSGDHFETNLRNLGSESAELDQATAWTHKFDEAFGSGIAGGFAILVPDRQDVASVVESLRAADAGKPEKARTFSRIATLDDVLPKAQEDKLSVLAQLRRILDRKKDLLDEEAQRRLPRLRPPETLRVLTDADVPAELAWPFTERDGSRGRIILANSGEGIDTWHTDSLRRFVGAVHALQLRPSVLVGGSSFVFQDMLDDMERDGPRATLLAGAGAVLIILLLVGANGYGLVTLLCGLFGTMALLTAALLWGIKINFLDFVALPITIGIGMDYAANITSRIRQELVHARDVGGDGTLEVGRTAMAVTLCSYTTVVGYGSLLISQNRGIRSFGLSAMIGEITCLTAALLIAPALAARLRRAK